MLTPPEMGGPYRIKGTKYPRMRRNRRRRKVLALLGAALAVAVVGWGTLQLIDVFKGDDDEKKAVQARQPEDCGARDTGAKSGESKKPEEKPAALPAPARVEVNVLNATTRSGLAQKTADELEKRGFKIGKVANAPAEYDKRVTGAGILLGAPGTVDGELKVLGTQLAQAEPKAVEREGAVVDLIIGDEFRGLTEPAEAKAALKALATPAVTKPEACD
ncbi:LytR C-terminal domain-containing protein [Streptomyces sp. WMMC500]|uniref:LytR C-terminal domain-containing protein n=1 Tax=Streptomyces sp. WMMC500 TaxID=3015154 RepID=UPI00248CF35F|nr:LytR C-terminal domain-containing protein [Streptomyces sp. WMMC500]WBB64570.1 LytR C-terminal domain-containing protein [Streptomyces sp. WMMC500]